MKKDCTPLELAEIISRRSTCKVQVGAVLFDGHGIFAWGWNSAGPHGLGLCAERHALSRANRKRLKGAGVAVFGRRKKAILLSFPCPKCWAALKAAGVKTVWLLPLAGEAGLRVEI